MKKLILEALIILALCCVVGTGVFEITAVVAIEKDVQEKISYLQQGDMGWVRYSKLNLAPELEHAIGSSTQEEGLGVSGLFVSSNEVGHKVGLAFPWGCKITFAFHGYDFEDFLRYCEDGKVKDYDGMLAAFEEYRAKNGKAFSDQVILSYHLKDWKWTCDYQDAAFLNGASCGMLSQYEGYYEASLQRIQTLIDKLEGEDE